jgi:hypothetical protein
VKPTNTFYYAKLPPVYNGAESSLRPSRQNSSPQMITFLMETIDRLLDGKIISSTGAFHVSAASQKRIGWMTIFRGFWSRKWLNAHITYGNAVPLRDPEDQEQRTKHKDRWLNKVSSFIMRQCHQLWLMCNNERHGVTPAEKAAALRTTAERELTYLFERRADCKPRHRFLFCTTLAEHKRHTITEIRNWLSMHSSIIRISCAPHRDGTPLQPAGT